MGLCGTSVAAPPPRDVGKEYRDTLLAQMQAHQGTGDFAELGSLPDLEAAARPGYVDLELGTLERMMTGSDGQKGLLKLYREDIYPQAAEMERRAKLDRAAADQEILDTHGTATTAAIRQASGNGRIMDLLRKQAETELDSDGQLTAADRREHEQAARSAQAMRGMGHGNNDAFMEAMQVGTARQARRRDQQAYAQRVAAQLQATGGDPMLSLLGRPSQTLGMGTQFAGQGMAQGNNLGTQLFNPESAYAADAYKGNQQAALAASTATASNNASMMGGLMGGLGALGGGLLGNAGLFKG